MTATLTTQIARLRTIVQDLDDDQSRRIAMGLELLFGSTEQWSGQGILDRTDLILSATSILTNKPITSGGTSTSQTGQVTLQCPKGHSVTVDLALK